jgi:hypothetical protein
VNVTVSAGPGAILVAPYEAQVAGGQTVGFRADAWDELGNRISVSPAWSVSGGGTIDSTGLFTGMTVGGPYSVTATSGGVSATGFVWVNSSGTATPPVLTTQPTNELVVAGSSAYFSVAVVGTQPLNYQWFFNSSPIGGATASNYTRPSVQSTDAGNYSVVVTNLAGGVTSSNALLVVNSPPMLAGISNRTVHAGATVVITNLVTDIDVPPQTLTFSLDPGFPPGARIGSTDGVFVWATTADAAGTTNPITVRVTDNGTPSLSDAKSFVIWVAAPLSVGSIAAAADGTVTLAWTAIPGTTYRVQYQDNWGDASWTPLAPEVIATDATATATDTIGNGQRFYRIKVGE